MRPEPPDGELPRGLRELGATHCVLLARDSGFGVAQRVEGVREGVEVRVVHLGVGGDGDDAVWGDVDGRGGVLLECVRGEGFAADGY